MSGFNTIIGFLFFFFILAGIVGYSMVSMAETINDNVGLMDSTQKQIENSKISFAIDSSYEGGGRLKLFLENNGANGFTFKDNNNVECFDVYINGKYISSDYFENYINDPLGNYYYVSPGEEIVLEIDTNIDESQDNEIKIVSCEGKTYKYYLDKDLYNWANTAYKSKSDFIFYNPTSNNLLNTYFLLELNSSNFDFTKATEDTIIIYLDLFENSVLDLNFDDYKQTLDDNSKYSNIAYLGANSASSSDDPILEENGIFFNSLNFDGINDFVRIASDQSLELEKALTYSAWIKWNKSGDTLQNIFTNGADSNSLKIVNDGGINNNKIEFDLNIGAGQILYSNKTIDNSWHNIIATYNGTNMQIYIDGTPAGEQSISGDITPIFADNYIGRNAAGTAYYNGIVDDFKVYNFALNESEIEQFYKNNYYFKELNYTIDSWDAVGEKANLSVKLPFIADNNENISIELYYYQFGENFVSEEFVIPPSNAPSAINDLSATFSNKEVTLNWSEPNDNGFAITSYTIEYGTVASGLFDNTYYDDATPNATITGLTNDVEYQFRVYSTNSEGNSATSNVVNSTPTGRFYFIVDTTTNLGVDGSANQGTTPIAYAQLQYGIPSSDTSASVGARTPMTNYIMVQEYTPTYSSQTQIDASATASLYVSGQNTGYTWQATLYEYNDATGNVGGVLGTASAITSATPQALSLTFNNAAFNVSAGNRLKVVIDATNDGNRQVDIYYGTGTQSYLQFDVK